MQNNTSQTSTSLDGITGAGCLTIFALPFAAVGTIVAVGVLWVIINCIRATSWVEVPTYIDHVELHSTRSSKGGSTYKVRANYHYEYNDKRFKSDRVYFGFGNDNIGSFQQDAYQALRNAKDNGMPFTGYVNPDAPEEVVLFRHIRWGLLGVGLTVAIAFNTVGYGLLFATFYGSRKINKENSLRALFPHQPWKHRTEWSTRNILPNTKISAIANIVIAVMWNAISTPILFIVPSELHKGNYFIALGLLFPLIGLSLIYSAVIKFMRWRKFKGARLELTTIPGYLGEKFSGKIHPGTAIEYNAHTEVILVCNKRTTSGKRNDGSPKSRASSQKQKIWEGKTRSSAIREIGGTAISFEIEIPPDKRPTTFDDTYPQISWTIIVTTALPGVDLYLEFDIPVTSRE